MKRLLYWLGLVDLVWTVDTQRCDNAVRLRIVWYAQGGRKFVFGICGPPSWPDPIKNGREVLSNGKLGRGDCSYLRRWYPYNAKPRIKGVGRVSPFKLK